MDIYDIEDTAVEHTDKLLVTQPWVHSKTINDSIAIIDFPYLKRCVLFPIFQLIIETKQNFRKHLSLVCVTHTHYKII